MAAVASDPITNGEGYRNYNYRFACPQTTSFKEGKTKGSAERVV
jgi:hypothetical protein